MFQSLSVFVGLSLKLRPKTKQAKQTNFECTRLCNALHYEQYDTLVEQGHTINCDTPKSTYIDIQYKQEKRQCMYIHIHICKDMYEYETLDNASVY